MTLEQYYFIGELIATGALIISLVYVGIQVKHLRWTKTAHATGDKSA